MRRIICFFAFTSPKPTMAEAGFALVSYGETKSAYAIVSYGETQYYKIMFKDLVYKFSKRIPKGKVATYGQLAKLAGNPRAARAVGVFMKIHPDDPDVPCHRVVGFDGSLTGFTAKGGIRTKREMLIKEGVVFKNNKVYLTRSQWKNVS